MCTIVYRHNCYKLTLDHLKLNTCCDWFVPSQLVSDSLATTRFSMTQSRGPRGAGFGPLIFEPQLIGEPKTTVIKKVACGDMFTACLISVYSEYYSIYHG